MIFKNNKIKKNIFDIYDIRSHIFTFLEKPGYRKKIIDRYLTILNMEQKNVLDTFIPNKYQKEWIYKNLNNMRLSYLLSKKMVFTYKCPFENITTKVCYRNFEIDEIEEYNYKIIKSFVIKRRYHRNIFKDCIKSYFNNIKENLFFKEEEWLNESKMKKTIFFSSDDIITKKYKKFIDILVYCIMLNIYILTHILILTKDFSIIFKKDFYWSNSFFELIFFYSFLFGLISTHYQQYIKAKEEYL
jgi:hypothetical protein